MKPIFLTGATLVAATPAAVLLWPSGTVPAPTLTQAQDLAQGAALYAENCASCHGAQLEGQPNWRQPGQMAPCGCCTAWI